MAFLYGNVSDNGTLYAFDPADPFVYLTQGAAYLQTGTNGVAFDIGVANAAFWIAGTIASNGNGVRVGAAFAGVTLTGTGAIHAHGIGISVVGGASGTTITNAGLIEGWNKAIDASTAGSVQLVNTGTISSLDTVAVQLGAGADSIRNIGRIVGSVALGDGADTFDARGGEVQGRIFGGAGGDTFYIDGDETIVEYSFDGGTDLVVSTGDYTLASGVENLTLIGAATRGTGNLGANAIIGNAAGGTLAGGGGDDRLFAGDGDTVLRGGSGDDQLSGAYGDDAQAGGNGNDRLIDLTGSNTLSGGAGDDVFAPGADDDAIDGGTGFDRVTYASAGGAVTADLTTQAATVDGAGADTLKSIEALDGSSFDDALTGSAVANTLFGDFGNDVLSGGGGDDLLVGGDGTDSLDGGAGSDTASYQADTFGKVTINLATGVLGGVAKGETLVSIENLIGTDGNDVLVGSDAANRLDGWSGNDQLTGGAGADVLVGGAGNDQLSGGADADVFLFADAPSGATLGIDTIADFQDGVDRISLVGNGSVFAFSDLNLVQQGSAVRIALGDGGIIKVLNATVAQFTAADFVFG